MFKKFLIASVLVAIPLGNSMIFAAENLTPQDICARLEIGQEIYVYNQAGDVLLRKAGETRASRTGHWLSEEEMKKSSEKSVCRIQNGSAARSSDFEGPIYFKHVWIVSPDGKITVTMEQYAEFEHHGGRQSPSFSKLLKSKTETVKDMTPIVWPSLSHKSERVVVVLSPRLTSAKHPEDLNRMAMSGSDLIITDNEGNLWARNLDAEGVYIGFDSLQGLLALSYYPFKGAKLLGRAQGNTIELTLPEKKIVSIYSSTAFLPGDVVGKVYGFYDPKVKSHSLNSQSVSASDKEDEFLEGIKRRIARKSR